MTKEGYTHIIVPKELHAILKAEAEESGMSISWYIAERLARLETIERVISTDEGINTSECTKKPSQTAQIKKKTWARCDSNA
jgi:hypothetical protein